MLGFLINPESDEPVSGVLARTCISLGADVTKFLEHALGLEPPRFDAQLPSRISRLAHGHLAGNGDRLLDLNTNYCYFAC